MMVAQERDIHSLESLKQPNKTTEIFYTKGGEFNDNNWVSIEISFDLFGCFEL